MRAGVGGQAGQGSQAREGRPGRTFELQAARLGDVDRNIANDMKSGNVRVFRQRLALQRLCWCRDRLRRRG
eukprot:COSAG06_NODE_2762_length_6327_cov_5.664740_9_plen_71_part_00